MKFEGIYTPVLTPFNAAGKIDYDAWAKVLDFQIDNGVHGVIVGGSTGEFYTMSKEERLAQFEFANQHIAGRIPWIAGVNDMVATEAYSYAKAAKATGASAMLVAAPPYSLPSEEELAAHCIRIDEAADLPIILYNYPGRTGVEMGEMFLDLVADRPNFAAIKESSGDVNRIHTLALKYPQMQLSAGAEDQVVEFFVWGARSWVCASANMFPKECVAFYETCVLEKNFEKGARFAAAFAPLMDALEQSGKFIQCVKYAAEVQGVQAGEARLPMLPMDEAAKAEFKAVVEKTATDLADIMAA